MQREMTPLYWAAAAAGGFACLIDLGSNLEWQLEQVKSVYTPEVFGVVAGAVMTAGSLTFALGALREKQVLSAAVFCVAFGIGAMFSLSATLDRVASWRDAKMQERLEQHPDVRRIDAEIAELKGQRATPEMKRLVEQRDEHYRQATYFKRLFLKEHRDRNGQISEEACQTRCRKYQGLMKAKHAEAVLFADKIKRERAGLKEEIAELRRERQTYVDKVDSMSMRINFVTAGAVSITNAGLFQPLLLPILLFAGNFFLAWGLGGRKADPVSKARRFIAEETAKSGKIPSQDKIMAASGLSRKKVKALLD